MFFKSFILVFGKFLGAFLGLLSGILLARELGSSNLGQYQLFISTQTILITLVTLGIGNASIYFINRNEITEKEIVTNFLKIFFVIGIFTSILFYIVVEKYPNYFGVINSHEFYIFLLGTISLILISILRPILYARQKINQVTIINIVPVIILIIGVLSLLLLKNINVSNVLCVWGIANCFTLIIALCFHKKNIDFSIILNNYELFKVIKYGVKISAANLLVVLISNTSIFFINRLSDNNFSDVGLYSRAIAISSIVFMIPSAVGPLLFSKWSTTDDVNLLKNDISKTLRVFNIVSLFTIFVCVIFSKLIIHVLYGVEYLGINDTLIVLFCSLFFQVLSEVFNNVLASQGKALYTMFSLMIMFVIIVIFNILLIPIYGILGAGLSVLIGSIINSICLYFIVNKFINIKILNTLLLKKEDLLGVYKLIYRIRK